MAKPHVSLGARHWSGLEFDGLSLSTGVSFRDQDGDWLFWCVEERVGAVDPNSKFCLYRVPFVNVKVACSCFFTLYLLL